ncbi:MAG: glutamate mutase L [Kosmotogaceae bacterium]|nr:glutamate mutase L [Kosmotogaceae bacterium]
MKVEFLTAEIGSTTTVLSAFSCDASGSMRFVGQGESYTTVDENDVTIGIENALRNLKRSLGSDNLEWSVFLASSSAAGGLRMTVHGLVYDMTVKAAREAALGAGGVIKLVTSGKLTERDRKKIEAVNPKLILLAGGVDYGEKETVIHNAEILRAVQQNVPIVFAGNVAAADDVLEIISINGREVHVVDNVYPRIDELNVEPTREVIREVFSRSIVNGPGMEKIYSVIDKPIIPTPAAVMLATELFFKVHGDVVAVDIGGATTDVDSVTDGDPEIASILLAPEPRSKRTVEGDLGIYVNASHVIEQIGRDKLLKEFYDLEDIIRNLTPYPKNVRDEAFSTRLAAHCFETSVRRHAGTMKQLFGPTGRTEVAYGKDLTAVKSVIGTGGILSRSKFSSKIMKSIRTLSTKHEKELLPKSSARLFRDRNYIFGAVGLISTVDSPSARDLVESSLEELNVT